MSETSVPSVPQNAPFRNVENLRLLTPDFHEIEADIWLGHNGDVHCDVRRTAPVGFLVDCSDIAHPLIACLTGYGVTTVPKGDTAKVIRESIDELIAAEWTVEP